MIVDTTIIACLKDIRDNIRRGFIVSSHELVIELIELMDGRRAEDGEK